MKYKITWSFQQMHMNTKKAFEKIQHSFMIETLIFLGIEGTYLNAIKTLCVCVYIYIYIYTHTETQS